MEEKKSLWAFGTTEVVYSGIGAALYGVLSWVTNLLQIPGAANVSVRPAVAIPMFFGVAYGPWVGFITGFLGTVIGDMISGYGFWPWWAIGSGLMGFFTGLVARQMTDYKSGGDILKAEIMVIVGIVVGMGLASLSEMWVSGADLNTAIVFNFIPAALTNLIWGLILTPVLMVAFGAVRSRSGR
jgi:energy-coupling factor transport system substrate-specific component